MKSQHAVRSFHFLLSIVLMIAIAACHGSKDKEQLLNTSKEANTQLGPRLISVQNNCGNTSIQIGNVIKQMSTAKPKPSPTPIPPVAYYPPMGVLTPTPTEAPTIPDVDPSCASAITQYLLTAKSLRGDDTPSPTPGHPPIPGPVLWQNPWFRQLTYGALGGVLMPSGPGAPSPAQLAMFASQNPNALASMTSAFGINSGDLPNFGSSFGSGTGGYNSSGSPNLGLGGLGSVSSPGFPVAAPAPTYTGGLSAPSQQLMFSSQARSAEVRGAAPTENVATDASKVSYQSRYGTDWFQRRAAKAH